MRTFRDFEPERLVQPGSVNGPQCAVHAAWLNEPFRLEIPERPHLPGLTAWADRNGLSGRIYAAPKIGVSRLSWCLWV
jgi:hypothetical protein